MSDSDPLDVEIEIDLGLEEPEPKAATDSDAKEVAEAEPEADAKEVAEAEPEADAKEVAEAEPEADAKEVAEAEPEADAKEVAEAEPEPEDDAVVDEIAASLANALAEMSPDEPKADTPPDEPKADTPPDEPKADTPPDESEAAEEPEPLVLPEIDVQNASELDFRKVGISAWKVKVKIGLIYDFSDIKTLRKYISDGRVTNEDVISHNGQDWTTLGDIPDLDAHFIDVYRHALAKNPELLRSEVVSSETPEELSEEAEELTNSILQQINQEVVANPPPNEATGPEFSDPFQELKKAQRSRGRQRQKMSKAREKHKAEMSHQNRLGLLLLGILIAVLWVINPFGGDEVVESAEPSTDNASQNMLENASVEEEGLSEVEREVQADVEAQLRQAKEDRAKEETAQAEPQRRAVRPPEALLASEASNSQGGSASASRPVPAARRAKEAYRQGNFKAAVEAFKEAVENAGGNPSPQIHLGYGKALYRTGALDPAYRHLMRAEKAGAADKEAYRFLIDLHQERGDYGGVSIYTEKLKKFRQQR